MTPSPTGWLGSAHPDGASAPSGRGPADDLGAEEAGDLADRVAATVLAVPGVVALHAGALGEVATLLPGRRVRGVRFSGPGGGAQNLVVVGDVATPAEQAEGEQGAREVTGP